MSLFKSRRGEHAVGLDTVLEREGRFVLDRRSDAGFHDQNRHVAPSAAHSAAPPKGEDAAVTHANADSPDSAARVNDFIKAAQPEKRTDTTRGESWSADRPLPTIGLALSGGGIRSASLGLGFIQSLRKHGLFRYVDYLSAISGGSYTGALVASSFYHATGDAAGPKGVQEAPLDIDLNNDTVQPPRVSALMSDGRYLIRPLEWANRFLSGWLALLLVVVSGLLSLSALVAYVWRSMDFYVVRDYLEVLGLGGDMWPAVLPLVILGIVWGVCWAVSYAAAKESARGILAKRVLILLGLWGITTIAALIGNGDIALSTGENPSHSNWQWPLIGVILSGLLPVFFRERLFKSGAVESSFWEKAIYRYTAIAVVVGIPMLCIGYFAQENVSGFSTSRDGRLLIGDVKDFSAFVGWFEQLPPHKPERFPAWFNNFAAEGNGISGGSASQSADGGSASERPTLTGPDELPANRNSASAPVLTDNDARRASKFKSVRVVPFQMLEKYKRRLTATNELQWLVGGGSWRNPPRAQSRSRSIAAEGANGQTGSSAFPVEPSASLPVDSIVAATPDNGVELQPYLPAATAPGSWREWLAWKYSWIKRRTSLIGGHLFHDDADDPLGSAVVAKGELREIQSQLLMLFNELILVDPDFHDYLTKEVSGLLKSPAAHRYPEGIQYLFSRLRQTPRADFSPEETLELNRSLLELWQPDLVRQRDELQRRNVVHADQTHRLTWAIILGCVFAATICFVNPNATSIQRYYQERLAAAYLGGSDEAHNMRLADMAPRMRPGPMLIVGGAANYRFRPADKERTPDPVNRAFAGELTDRVGHFEFSPFYCGSAELGYVPTEAYYEGRLRLADAVAISGAALNPAYFDRWEMLIIFSLLNLRMGQWLPNPACSATSLPPTFGRVLADVFDVRQRRMTRASERRHILLTDGGHFDNTGVQALLERRCKIIIVCDASQDDCFRFDDLALLIGRMKGKKGVVLREIGSCREIDLEARAAQIREQRSHFFCAEIRYDQDPAGVNCGLLIYFKSSLTGDEPPYVWNHAQKNCCFPHDSTINQSYGFEQFCAYLGLGQHMIDSLVVGRERAVEDVGSSSEYKQRQFASLFLGELDERRRNEFLDRLFMGPLTEEEHAALVAYHGVERRLLEAIKSRDWARMERTVDVLRTAVVHNQMFPRCLLGLPLELLANGMSAVDDPVGAAGEEALDNSARLVLEILDAKCNHLYPDVDDGSRRRRYMAAEIRSRFQSVERSRAVRRIVRQNRNAPYDFVGWLEDLLREGSAEHQRVVAEVLHEVGDLAFSEGITEAAELQRLLIKCRFSSSRRLQQQSDRLERILLERASKMAASSCKPSGKGVRAKSAPKRPTSDRAKSADGDLPPVNGHGPSEVPDTSAID